MCLNSTFWCLNVAGRNVMAGRKRKTLALTESAAPEKTVNKHETRTDPKVSPAKLKRSGCCENAESAERERSHYFTQRDQQHRLGEDFFNQPCVTLAKALLGKVRLSSHESHIHLYCEGDYYKLYKINKNLFKGLRLWFTVKI